MTGNTYGVDGPEGTVSSVWLWASTALPPGQVMVFGLDGEQIPELQGQATPQLVDQIKARSVPGTRWMGFDEDGPLSPDILRRGT